MRLISLLIIFQFSINQFDQQHDQQSPTKKNIVSIAVPEKRRKKKKKNMYSIRPFSSILIITMMIMMMLINNNYVLGQNSYVDFTGVDDYNNDNNNNDDNNQNFTSNNCLSSMKWAREYAIKYEEEHCGLLKRIKNDVCDEITRQFEYYVYAVADCFNIVLSDQCEQLKSESIKFFHVIEKNNCPINGKEMVYTRICPELKYLVNFVQFKYYMDCYQNKPTNKNNNHHNNHNNDQDITTTTTTTELYPDINNNKNNDDVHNYIDKIDNIDNYIEHVFDL